MREGILELSVHLFAKAGFDGVSMRDIAKAVGVTPAALYHHFSDKDQLYLDAVDFAYKKNMTVLNAALGGDAAPWIRLESFVVAFTQLLSAEKDFQRLLQWVILDTDEQRTQRLTDNVFRDMLVDLYKLVSELGEGYDPHLLTVSIMSLILLPFASGKASRHLPGYQPNNENPVILAKHIVSLLRNGIHGGAHTLADAEMPSAPRFPGRAAKARGR